MKVYLPIQEKVIKDGELIKTPGEKEFDLDMSVAGQMRFEAKFPELAEKEDLFGYSKRICSIEDLTGSVMLSKMKMLYCWFDTELSFVEFLKMFDLSDTEFSNKLTGKIHEIFEIVFNGSVEKN